MTGPIDVIWPIEPHTRAKHEILKVYLQAWFPIMARYNGRIIVLDGFAGPGEYSDGSKGSPLIAIETWLSHTVAQSFNAEVIFYFIEANVDRCEHLKDLLRRSYPQSSLPRNISWQVINDTFDEHLSGLLDELDKTESLLAPTFAFIDPFGYSHTPMSTVSRLMSYPKCEVLVNFMYEEANRFMSWENQANDSHLDRLFGTMEWRTIRQSPLTPKEREQRIRDLYARQLTDVGGATYVRAFRMRNRSNRTDYYLFFGTKSLRGLDKMKQAMWKVDPSGAYDFSDTTDPNQYVLFQPNPDYSALQAILHDALQGRTMTVQDVEDFVIANTAYCSNHYKTHVLKPMEKLGLLAAINADSKRKAGTYPDPTLRLRFL